MCISVDLDASQLRRSLEYLARESNGKFNYDGDTQVPGVPVLDAQTADLYTPDPALYGRAADFSRYFELGDMLW